MPYKYLTEKVHRPTGVTIIAILTIIIGIIAIFGGISIVVIGAFLSAAPISLTESNNTTITDNVSPQVVQFFGIIAAVVGSILLAIGIGYIVMSYGLLRAKGWAWTITIILVIIGIGIQVLSAVTGPVFNASFVRTSDVDATNSLISGIVGSVIGIAISILILYYLYRPNVKSYFGKMQ
ncbi:MAG: hypothetical protein M3297_10650 [Thermoproteota archaeon]|nr:hypothetical protein [Thermoproteota archaeon]